MNEHHFAGKFSSFPIATQYIGLVLFFLALAFSVLPFCVVQLVPATDLPQHLAQVRLFFDLLSSGGHEAYSISFFNANVLVYWVLAFLWLLLPPLLSAKVLMAGLAIAWVSAVFLLAGKTSRPFSSALLAATLVFNASFYWGFVNFLIGFPLFILWYIVIANNHRKELSWKTSIVLCLLSIFLFLAHALWLAAAFAVLVIINVRRKASLRTLLFQALGILPVAIIAMFWFPSMAATRTILRFDTAPHWIVSPFERFYPVWIVNSLYGGLHSPVEWLLVLTLLGWSAFSLFSNKDQLRILINWDMLIVAFFFFCVVMLAPEKYVNTIYFASRWYPVAATFFLLALPAPRFSIFAQGLLAVVAFVMLSVVTTFSWRGFEKHENSGLLESLEKIPPRVRVVGLDFVKESQILCGRPFMQSFAYAQALGGSEINFSFAMHHSGIVKTSTHHPKQQWSSGLEWFPEWVRFEDFQYFDYALVNAHDDLHSVLSLLPVLTPLSETGRWRLYKCNREVQMTGPLFKNVQ